MILKTALKLFVENGFHGTATSKIAQEAGVANGTLFNYYATKETLIVSLYNSIVKNMDDFIMDSLESSSVSKESFHSLFFAILQWNLNNTTEFQYLQQFKNSPYYKAIETTNLKLDENPLFILIQNGINIVLIKPLPASLIFSLFTAQIDGLCYYINTNSVKDDERNELINLTFDLIWKTIED